jgi:glycosyltransferase involved in cell wall biosynthesis
MTVLIINYNYGRYLPEAIESVLKQDFDPENLEVIVVDDGSTDDSAERIRPYRSRVHWMSKINGGQVSAFNAGFLKARGEYIALLEADDFWDQGKLRETLSALEHTQNSSLVQHWLMQIDEFSNPLPGYSYPSEPMSFTLSDAVWGRIPLAGTSSLVFRADDLRSFLPLPNMPYGADICLRAIAATRGPILNIPKILGRRRIHGNNLFGESLLDDPKKIEIGINVGKALNVFYRNLSHGQEAVLNKNFFSYFELQQMEAFFFQCRYQHQWHSVWKAWRNILSLYGTRRYRIFKALSLLLALLSPKFYLSCQRHYSRMGWVRKVRNIFFLIENAPI